MEEMDKIAILMATYNGEKYIREQLDSLLGQSYRNFKIYVRDDGSADETVEIIREYQSRYPDFIVLVTDNTLHRGARDSFMYLLSQVKARYYMFCDQDDVWLKDKIAVSFAKLRELEGKSPEKPIMVHTDLRVVDEDLKMIYNSLWRWAGFNVDLNKHFNYTVIGNVFTGCTMIFNRIARDIALPIHPKSSMHDEWIGLLVAKNGVVDNIKEQTILYRQHGKNVCSIGEKKDFSKQRFSFKSLYQWYYKQKELLDFLHYGSVYKAVFFKLLYILKRKYSSNL